MKVFGPIGQLVTMAGAVQKEGRHSSASDLSILENAALVVSDKGKIEWVGYFKDIPKKFSKIKKVSLKDKLVLPGLIDSHTHLVWAGNRAQEFELKLQGASYQEIAKMGGGILFSMKHTRLASKADLEKLASARLRGFLSQGVTTVEIKTGYGLDFKSEKKTLEVITELEKKSPVTVKKTFLAAHAIPPEFKNRGDEYIQTIAEEWLPKIKNKVDFVDIFVDEGFFTKEHAHSLAEKAKSLRLGIKIHADELALTGGTETAVAVGAVSADHCLKITSKEIKLAARSNTTITLLPMTAFFMKKNYAPARELLDAGARVALATDFNPGTCPSQDLSFLSLLSQLQMGMKLHEVLCGLTLNGAYALGLEKQKGALCPGFDADFVVSGEKNLSEFFYGFGKPQKPIEVYVSAKKVIAI